MSGERGVHSRIKTVSDMVETFHNEERCSSAAGIHFGASEANSGVSMRT